MKGTSRVHKEVQSVFVEMAHIFSELVQLLSALEEKSMSQASLESNIQDGLLLTSLVLLISVNFLHSLYWIK